MSLHHLSEPAKQVMDYSIAVAGLAFAVDVLPYLTGLGALLLIIVRIAVGLQEHALNRRKLDRRDEE